jgi:hypothetical protein
MRQTIFAVLLLICFTMTKAERLLTTATGYDTYWDWRNSTSGVNICGAMGRDLHDMNAAEWWTAFNVGSNDKLDKVEFTSYLSQWASVSANADDIWKFVGCCYNHNSNWKPKIQSGLWTNKYYRMRNVCESNGNAKSWADCAPEDDNCQDQ